MSMTKNEAIDEAIESLDNDQSESYEGSEREDPEIEAWIQRNNMLKKIWNWQPSVGARFAFAFWCGWAFHMGSDLISRSFIDQNWIALSILSILTLIPLIIYSKNKVKFEQEHFWMMIKTGGPKEEDKFGTSNINSAYYIPNRPPPPPAPPKRII